jgi:hypothetical protein
VWDEKENIKTTKGGGVKTAELSQLSHILYRNESRVRELNCRFEENQGQKITLF